MKNLVGVPFKNFQAPSPPPSPLCSCMISCYSVTVLWLINFVRNPYLIFVGNFFLLIWSLFQYVWQYRQSGQRRKWRSNWRGQGTSQEAQTRTSSDGTGICCHICSSSSQSRIKILVTQGCATIFVAGHFATIFKNAFVKAK